jgi:hypothetical protein
LEKMAGNEALDGQADWLAAIPQVIRSRVSTANLRGPEAMVATDGSEFPRNSLKLNKWAAFRDGTLSANLFADID